MSLIPFADLKEHKNGEYIISDYADQAIIQQQTVNQKHRLVFV